MLWNEVCKCGHTSKDHYKGQCHGWKAEGVTDCTCTKWRPKREESWAETKVLRKPRRLVNVLKQKNETRRRRSRERGHTVDG